MALECGHRKKRKASHGRSAPSSHGRRSRYQSLAGDRAAPSHVGSQRAGHTADKQDQHLQTRPIAAPLGAGVRERGVAVHVTLQCSITERIVTDGAANIPLGWSTRELGTRSAVGSGTLWCAHQAGAQLRAGSRPRAPAGRDRAGPASGRRPSHQTAPPGARPVSSTCPLAHHTPQSPHAAQRSARTARSPQ
jgi:hypothetical protein